MQSKAWLVTPYHLTQLEVVQICSEIYLTFNLCWKSLSIFLVPHGTNSFIAMLHYATTFTKKVIHSLFVFLRFTNRWEPKNMAYIKFMPNRYDQTLIMTHMYVHTKVIWGKTLIPMQCRQFVPHAPICTDKNLITLTILNWTYPSRAPKPAPATFLFRGLVAPHKYVHLN